MDRQPSLCRATQPSPPRHDYNPSRFAETWWGSKNPGGGGEGSRVFDVQCNGATLLPDFDVLQEAGGENRALVKTFRDIKPNPQGRIELSFVPKANYGMVNAIEIIQQ